MWARCLTALSLGATLAACDMIDHGIWEPGDPALPTAPGEPEEESRCGASEDWVEAESGVDVGPFDAAFIADHIGSTGSVHFDVFDGPDGRPAELSNWRWCSGTLIGPDLFLTAAHCLEPRGIDGLDTPQAMCDRLHVDFDYQRAAVAGNPGRVGAIRVFDGHGGRTHACAAVVEYGADDGLDYAILRLDGDPGVTHGMRALATGFASGDDLLIAQHPRGVPKVVHAGTVHGDSAGAWLRYGDLDTDGGSSGSGVLDRRGRVIGVHVQGGCRSSGGTNRAVTMAAIGAVSPVIADLLGDQRCLDADRDGFGSGPGCAVDDCDDANRDISPAAAERCNDIDDDCDGAIDEGLPHCGTLPLVSWYSHQRGDHFTTTHPLWVGQVGDRQPPDYDLIRVEGRVFDPDRPAPAGTVPLFSWYSPGRADNWLSTALIGEVGDVSVPDYEMFRVEGYVFARQTPGTVPLVSWYSPSRGDNRATTDPVWVTVIGDRMVPDYEMYRIEGYVYPR